MSERPDWLHPGAEVAVLHTRHGQSGGRINRTTVDRIGKRDVVLADGQRFNVNRLRRHPGNTWDGRTEELVAADDPKVEAVRRGIALVHASALVDRLLDKVAKSKRNLDYAVAEEAAEELPAAVAAWVEMRR